MAVLNRQMFRQPFPVVHRMAGTPQEGEFRQLSQEDFEILHKLNLPLEYDKYTQEELIDVVEKVKSG